MITRQDLENLLGECRPGVEFVTVANATVRFLGLHDADGVVLQRENFTSAVPAELLSERIGLVLEHSDAEIAAHQ